MTRSITAHVVSFNESAGQHYTALSLGWRKSYICVRKSTQNLKDPIKIMCVDMHVCR